MVLCNLLHQILLQFRYGVFSSGKRAAIGKTKTGQLGLIRLSMKTSSSKCLEIAGDGISEAGVEVRCNGDCGCFSLF